MFITVPIISKALGPTKYGYYNYAITISSYFALAANWGFLAKGVRDIAAGLNRENTVSMVLSSRIVLWLVGNVIGIGGYLILFGWTEFLLYVILASLTSFVQILFIDFYFYGKRNTFIPSLATFLAQLVQVLLVYFVFRFVSSIISLFLIFFVAKLLEVIVLYVNYDEPRLPLLSLSFHKSWLLFKSNFYLGLGSKVSFLQSSVPILLIPIVLTPEDLGYFSVANKIFLLIAVIFQTFNLVFSPSVVLCREYSERRRKRTLTNLFFIYVISGILCSLLIYVLAGYTVDELFGLAYEPAIELLQAPYLLLIPVWSIYMFTIMVLNNFKLDKEFFQGSIYQIVTLCFCLLFLLPLLGLAGVVYSITIASIISCSIWWFNILKK